MFSAPPLACLLLAALPFTQVFTMAVPPQSDESLRASSQRVVVGEVLAVYQREVKVEGGTDLEFVATVKPLKQESALIKDAPLEALLYVHYRQVGKRPAGWTGPVGQSSMLGIGEKVRLFLSTGRHGAWELLEPNGFRPVE